MESTSSLVAQQVKDLALSVQHLGSLLWNGFDPWPGNFHMSWMWPPPKKKKTESKRSSALLSMICDYLKS